MNVITTPLDTSELPPLKSPEQIGLDFETASRQAASYALIAMADLGLFVGAVLLNRPGPMADVDFERQLTLRRRWRELSEQVRELAADSQVFVTLLSPEPPAELCLCGAPLLPNGRCEVPDCVCSSQED